MSFIASTPQANLRRRLMYPNPYLSGYMAEAILAGARLAITVTMAMTGHTLCSAPLEGSSSSLHSTVLPCLDFYPAKKCTRRVLQMQACVSRHSLLTVSNYILIADAVDQQFALRWIQENVCSFRACYNRLHSLKVARRSINSAEILPM